MGLAETQERERTLIEMALYAMERLPPDWEIVNRFTREEVSISLYDPEGKDVEVCTLDCCNSDTSNWGAFVAHVNAARKGAGLEPVPED